MRDLSAAQRLEDSVADLEASSAEQVLSYALEHFYPGLAVACSFQKEESVLLHMVLALEPSTPIFTIDTGVLFPETREIWREFEQRYGIEVEIHDALSTDGAPWTAERCCSERKVAALRKALAGRDAWVTGLRREQAPTRAQAAKLQWDAAHGLWKANPLADWSERDVWNYITEHELPYHPLHDQGYGSIGCAPCTLPGTGREGRWAGSDKTECGLHGEPPADGAGVEISVSPAPLRVVG
jgi:phosphoadenosine phosphosulfate reductase